MSLRGPAASLLRVEALGEVAHRFSAIIRTLTAGIASLDLSPDVQARAAALLADVDAQLAAACDHLAAAIADLPEGREGDVDH